MPIAGRDLLPTRSVELDLREEQRLVREGYDFLDEKRLLLAAEILRELERWRQTRAEYAEAERRARAALARATARHGLEGLLLYPAAGMEKVRAEVVQRSFLGVVLVEAQLAGGTATEPAPALNPSPEAEACRAAFAALIECAARLAGISGNLHRLADEYRRTERRARALENVLMPEIDEALREISEHLESAEQEEAVRVRRALPQEGAR